MTLMIMSSLPFDSNMVSAFRTVFYIAAIGSLLAGSLFSERLKRLHFLCFWMLLGTLCSFLLIFVNNVGTGYISIIFLLLGVSFGLGMPSSFAYMADSTYIENRGCISSLIFFAANFVAFPLAILAMILNPEAKALLLTLWRGIGLVFFLSLKPKQQKFEETKRHVSFATVLHDRSFFLYILPWLMFCLIDILEKSLLENFTIISLGQESGQLIATVEPLIGSLAILAGGLLCDRIGRKRVLTYGFVSLGIAYAIIGITPTQRLAWYFYMIVDGVAGGILGLIFVLILWGDLSQTSFREKYYAVGSVPLLARNIVPVFLMPMITLVPPTAAFSLASFFLFLALLPLMYVPETLPEKKIELRRLKGYIEQAKKLTEKYTNKSSSKR